QLKAREGILEAAQGHAVKDAQEQPDGNKEALRAPQAAPEEEDYQKLNEAWIEKDAYAADAYRLLANYNTPCLSCHAIGNIPPKQAQGPPLDLTWERLRPEWTLRWIANPERMISYPTPTPQNFPANKVDA